MRRELLLALLLFSAGCDLGRPTREAPVIRVGYLPSEEAASTQAPAVPLTESEALIAEGKSAYQNSCVTCHGSSGRGNGPAAAGLQPPPRDFTDKAVMQALNDARLAKTIKEGGAAVGKSPLMVANPQLSDGEVKAIVAYIRTFAK